MDENNHLSDVVPDLNNPPLCSLIRGSVFPEIFQFYFRSDRRQANSLYAWRFYREVWKIRRPKERYDYSNYE
jgi:hypothetical protein